MHYPRCAACRRTSMPARPCSRASSCPGSSNWAASLNSSRCWRRWSRRAPRSPGGRRRCRLVHPAVPWRCLPPAARGRAVPRDPRAGWRALVQHVAGDARVDEFLDRNVETATDALRLAVALSGGDVSLTTATTRFAPMKRGVRRLLLRLLDRAPNAVEDVMRHAERWKRLAEVLHRATTPTNTRAPWRPSRRRGATTRRPRSGRASRRCWPNGTSPRSRPCCNNVPANSRAGWT